MGEFAWTRAGRGRERAQGGERNIARNKEPMKGGTRSLQNDRLCLGRELEHLTFCLRFTQTLPALLWAGVTPRSQAQPLPAAVNQRGCAHPASTRPLPAWK